MFKSINVRNIYLFNFASFVKKKILHRYCLCEILQALLRQLPRTVVYWRPPSSRLLSLDSKHGHGGLRYLRWPGLRQLWWRKRVRKYLFKKQEFTLFVAGLSEDVPLYAGGREVGWVRAECRPGHAERCGGTALLRHDEWEVAYSGNASAGIGASSRCAWGIARSRVRCGFAL